MNEVGARYKEVAVKYFGNAESGPFAVLEDGRRVYGICGLAPFLLEALEELLPMYEQAVSLDIYSPSEVHSKMKRADFVRSVLLKAKGGAL